MSVPRRPCLALPFTVLAGADAVHLVAGEEFRYTLNGPGLERWLPGWLSRMTGRSTLDELLRELAGPAQEQALAAVERLAGERVLIDGPAVEAHPARRYRLAPEGRAAWVADLQSSAHEEETASLPVLCQDTLDYDEALGFNRRCLAGAGPWLWVSTGPLVRGLVSPVFLPDAGPCLACLLRHFRQLSPAPPLYDALIEHGRNHGSFAAVPFPPRGLAVLTELARWKVEQLGQSDAIAALYELHVLETASMEVSAHRVLLDPECPECRGRR